mgnify:CR=1 FL=1
MRIALDDIRMIGGGLSRPESVLAHSSGLLIAPDWTDPGGVARYAHFAERRERLGSTARRHAIETYSWDRVSESTARLYGDLVPG